MTFLRIHTVLLSATLFCGTALALRGEIVPGHNSRNETTGLTIIGDYAVVQIATPDKARGFLSVADFNCIPVQDEEGVRTLDEDEAKVRFLLKPQIDILKQRPNSKNMDLVNGNLPWDISSSVGKSSETITIQHDFGAFEQPDVSSKIDFTLDLQHATYQIQSTFRNASNAPRTVVFMPTFSTLLQETKVPTLCLPRTLKRYSLNGEEEFHFLSATPLNADFEAYWWRQFFSTSNSRTPNIRLERVQFDPEKFPSPERIGIANLAGKNLLIWNFSSPLTQFEVRWQTKILQLTPRFELQLAPGEEKSIAMDGVLVKGLLRFDSIRNDCVFAYTPTGDTLNIAIAPLDRKKGITVGAQLANSKGALMLNRSNELAQLSPLAPTQLNYQANAIFQKNERYYIRVQASETATAQRLWEINDLIVP